VYPFSIVPPLLALLERALPEPTARFAILHLLTFATAGIACAAVYTLVRPCGRAFAWLAAAAFWAQPGVQALACQIGLEMPFAACVACMLAALAEKRWAAAFAAALLALLVKPTGIVAPVAALIVYLARRYWPRSAGAPSASERRWAGAHVLLVVAFALELFLLRAFDRGPPGAGLFAGAIHLVTKRVWTVPEFGFALVLLTLLAFAAFARRNRDRAIPPGVLASAAFLAAYMGLLAQWENALSRYFVVAYPAILALLVVAFIRFTPRAFVGPAIGAVALFGLIGARGALQPDRPGQFAAPGETEPLASNDGWLLERSLRYRDGLALDLELARFADARPDAVFVAAWPLQQALVEPSFGYVKRPVTCASTGSSVAWTASPIPDLDALRASGKEMLWILNPVDFAGDTLVPRSGDVVVARFAVGAQRAFVVRRPNFP
jgi:hypothetical protein